MKWNSSLGSERWYDSKLQCSLTGGWCLGPYVTVTGPKDGATAAGGRLCYLSP